MCRNCHSQFIITVSSLLITSAVLVLPIEELPETDIFFSFCQVNLHRFDFTSILSRAQHIVVEMAQIDVSIEVMFQKKN